MRTRLLTVTVTDADMLTVTVTVDGKTATMPWTSGVAAGAGENLWLLERGRRWVILGSPTAATYDNPRAYDAPVTYDGS